MGTNTPVYGFQLPTDGGDDDVWGADYLVGDPAVDPSPGLNGNWSKTDILLQDMQDRVDALQSTIATIPDEIIQFRIKPGQLFITTSLGDPSTILGYGTWERWENGRIIVGVGSNGSVQWNAYTRRGNETVALTSGQNPSHTHSVNPPATQTTTAGNHNHGNVIGAVGGNDGGAGGTASAPSRGTRSTNGVGDHTHTIDIGQFNSSTAGSGSPHNNVQPTKAAYIWRRLT
ncbi:MAG: hypothetical protein GKR86_00075 [Ilumatobacter sp.]|nr:hypothetical protein [Ilumatobacter sp.]